MLENLTVLQIGSDPIKTDTQFFKQYTQLFETIVADAVQHNFYSSNLSLELFAVKAMAAIRYSIYHEPGWGWALVKDNSDDFIEPEYVFVYPKQRRKGWFTSLVALLEEQNKPSFTVCTREERMIKALHKLGFHINPNKPFAQDGSLAFNKQQTTNIV